MNTVELQFYDQFTESFVTMDIDKSVNFPIDLKSSEITKPTAVMFDSSKEISLPKTKHNNNYFSEIWRLDSRPYNFEPNDRTDFRLYVNGDLFTSGYVQLKEISDTYKITLYGGLGDYFYSMDEKPLNELKVGNKYDHKVNSGNVQDFFEYDRLLNTSGENIGDSLGYAMTYQGDYDSFDNKSVVEDGEVKEVVWDNSRKQYVDVELNEHSRTYDATQSRQLCFGEYRSYYQKPMIRIKEVITQIAKDMEEEGWTTDFDSSFFNEFNPYWQDLWCILPNYEPTASTEGDEKTTPGATFPATGYQTKTSETYRLTLDTLTEQKDYFINVEVPYYLQAIYISGDRDRVRKGSSLFVRAELRVGGTKIGDLIDEGSGNPTLDLYHNKSKGTLNYKHPKDFPGSIRDFYYYYDGNYDSMQKDPGVRTTYTFKGSFDVPVSKLGNGKVEVVFTVSGDTNWAKYSNGDKRAYGLKMLVQNGKIGAYSTGSVGTRSNSTVSFKDIIRSNISQLDFFFSYCKVFGLYFVKDKYKKEVKIMTRNTYFGAQEIVDWTYKLDTQRARSINPVAFDFKKGLFQWKSLGSKYEEEYLAKYGREYGSFRFDTNNNFTKEEKNMIEGNIFDNCIISTEYSKYYLDRSEEIYKDNKILPYLQDKAGSGVDNSFTLVFKDGRNSTNYFLVTDDEPVMLNLGYCWTNDFFTTTPPGEYPRLLRTMQVGTETYSLYWGVPSVAYNDEEENTLTEGATLYSKFWKKFLEDRFSRESKKLTAYFTLTLSDIQSDLLRKFIYIDGSLWVINKIIDFNPLSSGPTKVELISVQDINNYVSQNYTAGNLIIRNSSGTPIYDASGATASAASPAELRVSNTATSATFIIDSTVPWEIGDLAEGVTATPLSGPSGQTTVRATFPANTSNDNQVYNIPITWEGQTTSLQILIVGNWTVTATANQGTASVNGSSSASVADGSTVTLTTTAGSNYGFAYWEINGAYYYTQTLQITITENTTAAAYWYDRSQYVKMETDDTNTTIQGVTKHGNFWLLQIGTSYTFVNDQTNLTGFLFGSDTKYTQDKQRTIQTTDTTLKVLYDAILLNVTVRNESPTQDFTGENIHIGEFTFDFEVEPEAEIEFPQEVPAGEVTNDRYPYHYIMYEGYTEFTTFGVYDLTIIAHRVGWEGDETVNLEEGGADTFDHEVYGPVEYTLTTEGDVTVLPDSGDSDMSVSISVGMNGGTKYIHQNIGEFVYTLTIAQPSIKPIGWLGDGTVTLNVNVDKDVTEYETVFYNNELSVELSEGLEIGEQQEEQDGSTYFEVTATFEPNTALYPVTRTFTVICNGTTYTLNITQGAGEIQEGNYWGQSPDESGAVTGKLTGADGLTPSESCLYDLGSEDKMYRDAYFCGTINGTVAYAETANKVSNPLTIFGYTYDGSAPVDVTTTTDLIPSTNMTTVGSSTNRYYTAYVDWVNSNNISNNGNIVNLGDLYTNNIYLTGGVINNGAFAATIMTANGTMNSRYNLFVVQTNTGSMRITLPPTSTIVNGYFCWIKHVNVNGGFTLVANGGQTIRRIGTTTEDVISGNSMSMLFFINGTWFHSYAQA